MCCVIIYSNYKGSWNIPGHKGPLELVWKFAFNLSQDSALHVRFDCLEKSFVFCLDPRERESPPLPWCLVNLRIYIYHQKRLHQTHWTSGKTPSVSRLPMLTTRLIDNKKMNFPISHLQGLRLLFTFSICSQSPLWDTLTCSGTKRGRQEYRNMAKTRRQWNSVATSWGTHLILQFAPQLAILICRKNKVFVCIDKNYLELWIAKRSNVWYGLFI